MKTRIYTVYDRVAEDSGPVFTAPNDAVAGRSFRRMAENKAPGYMDDFQLLWLGVFDSSTCKIEGLDQAVEVFVGMPVDPAVGGRNGDL